MSPSRLPRLSGALLLLGGCVSQSPYERTDVTLERIELRDAWLQTAAIFGLVLCLALLLVAAYYRRTRRKALDGLFQSHRAVDVRAAVRAWWTNEQARSANQPNGPTTRARRAPRAPVPTNVRVVGAIVAATFLGGAGFLLAPAAYEVYALLRFHEFSERVYLIQHHVIPLRTFLSFWPFVYAAVCSTLLTWLFVSSRRFRHMTARARGVIATGLVYGTLVWLAVITYSVITTPERTRYEVSSWFAYAVLFAIPLVWSVVRLAPDAVPRRSLRAAGVHGRQNTPDESQMLKIALGSVIAVPATLGLHYIMTDPAAGFMMIMALFVGVAEAGALLISAGLVVGGVWGLCGWRGQRVVTTVPIVLGLGVIVFPLVVAFAR